MEEYYKRLGLTLNATEKELKKAFRKLAMKYHPDRNPSPDAAQRFHEINEAYEILIGEREPPRKKRVSQTKPQQTSTSSQRNQANTARSKQQERAAYAQRMREERARKEKAELIDWLNKFYAFQRSWIAKTGYAVLILNALLGMTILIDAYLPDKVISTTEISVEKDGERYVEKVNGRSVAFNGFIQPESSDIEMEFIVTPVFGEIKGCMLNNQIMHVIRSSNKHFSVEELDNGEVMIENLSFPDEKIIWLLAGLVMVFYRKPFPVYYVFFYGSVAVTTIISIVFLAGY